MDRNVIDNIYDSDLNNELEVNTMKDIINSIGFKSEEDKLMCEVIITNLENMLLKILNNLRLLIFHI